MNRQLRGFPIAMIDTETTSLVPGHVVSVSVAYANLGNTGATIALSTLVRPPVPIPPETTAIHGITDAMVADAPTFADVAPALTEAIGDRLPAAFNAPFDYGFLRAEYERIGVTPPRWPWFDACVLGKVVDRYQRGKRLVDILARRAIVLDAHGSAGDALGAAIVATRLIIEGRIAGVLPQWGDVDTYLAWQRTTALAAEREYVEYMARAGTHGKRPTCPWHEVEGIAPPPWDVKAETMTCSCGAEVRTRIAKDGTVSLVGIDDQPHTCVLA